MRRSTSSPVVALALLGGMLAGEALGTGLPSQSGAVRVQPVDGRDVLRGLVPDPEPGTPDPADGPWQPAPWVRVRARSATALDRQQAEPQRPRAVTRLLHRRPRRLGDDDPEPDQ